ncbi:MAG: hypothetical protein NXH86_02520 [Flavobacteriaceae bacterium]|uniref:Uncharacterized protein n=1 Tax=Flagellimonas olearia TaxID=552546 RepID=A0A444VPI4_9FLAO|nr:hypothetical protein [Allomuricauda olearia]MCR9262999.1 hypothetical protein [Flavobacteriaceae bacterium]RYC52714.1 hypothetical protein DN53_00410 [Allomuricauda olearia]
MLHSKGQKNCSCCTQGGAEDEVKITPKISKMLSPAQVQLLDYTHYLDAPDLVKALKLVHDVTIYHSHELLDEAEKDALFSVKGLWECIERIKE